MYSYSYFRKIPNQSDLDIYLHNHQLPCQGHSCIFNLKMEEVHPTHCKPGERKPSLLSPKNHYNSNTFREACLQKKTVLHLRKAVGESRR